MTNTKIARNSSIDLIKTIAIFFVIVIHTCADGLVSTEGNGFVMSLIWRCLAAPAVPLFLMSSGALMLDTTKELSLKKLWSKNILRLVVAMLFWAIAYKLAYIIIYDSLTIHNIYMALIQVFTFNQEFHLYYIHIILLFYAFLPIVKSFVKNADKKTLEYLLIFWFAVGIIFPTIVIYKPIIYISGYPLQWMMNFSYCAIGYAVLGRYLASYPPKKHICIAVGTISFLIIIIKTIIASRDNNALYTHYIDGANIFVCLFGASIFGFCQHLSQSISASKRLNGILTYLSKASFCIYLVHVFILRLFSYFNFNVFVFCEIFSIPFLAICNVAICVLIYFVISKVPVLNKWII